MKCKTYIFFLLTLFQIFNITLYAQSPRFVTYKVLKNRKNVEVNCVFQDSRGYMWLGTNDGLIKYDGVEFILFTELDSLADNATTSISQDREGNLWIGHKSGKITINDGKEFSKFSPEEGLSKQEISSFFIDLNDIPWFSTYGEGVYYYDGAYRERLYNINTDDGLLSDYVYTIVGDDESRLYFATDQGISVYDIENKLFIDQITSSDGLPDIIVTHLVINENDLWIAMEDGGICKYNILTKEFSLISDWKFGSINDFIFLSNSEIWVSTKRNGIIRIDYDDNEHPIFTVYGRNSDIPDIRTLSIFKDKEENIWIGTQNGLSVRKNNNIEFLNEKDGFNIKDIFGFVIDDQGSYWVASQRGLYIVRKGEMGKIEVEPIAPDKDNMYSFISLYKDQKGKIWAGTYGYGVFIIDPVTLKMQNFTSETGLSNDNVIHISGDGTNIWLSTLGGGVTKFRSDNLNESIVYTTSNGLTSNYVYSTFTDSKKRTWIATDGGGLFYIENESIHPFYESKVDTLQRTIYSVIEDGDNNIWFNCSNDGLFRFDGDTVYNFNEMNGLKTNFIQGLTTDVSGNPVIISNEGIDKFIIRENLFEYHGETDGVAYLEPNLNSLYKDVRGNIWVGTANGIIILKSDKNNSSDIKPDIFITQKSIFLNPVTDDKNSFRHNKNYLTFNYTALWYKSSENLTFRYKLEGFDPDWNMATSLRQAPYPNLPSGDYKFVVQVNYSGGKWIGSPDSEYSFRIRKPFWRTAWFIISFIIFILGVIYAYIENRIKTLKRAKELLEDEVKKRTAEIELQKQEIVCQRDEIEIQHKNVTIQRDKIELQNKNITSSIEYASRIQRAVVPSIDNFNLHLGEHFIFFRPKDIVSGDFYYLNIKGDNIIVAAADCTGHGVPGAFMSILGISLLNQIISQGDDSLTAGYILDNLRKEIKIALRQTGKSDEAKDGMDISLCILNRKEQFIQFAGAYNPMILVSKNEYTKYPGDKMPIGIFLREEMEFSNQIIKVGVGDMIYLFSDGYQDQFGGEQKKKFFSKNFNSLLLAISKESLERQREILEDTLNKWMGSESQVDDILVIGFKI